MPATAAASGSKLASVIPGIVFTSKTVGARLFRQQHIHSRINVQTDRAMRPQRQVLNFAR